MDSPPVKIRSCKVCRSPLSKEIGKFLEEKHSYTTINEWLIRKSHQEFDKATLSRHKTKCMKLPADNMNDPRKFEAIQDEEEGTTDIRVTRDLAMKEFTKRLKYAPHLVSNAQLIPFLVEALRAENRRPPTDPLDAILSLFSEVTGPETSTRSEAEVRETDRSPESVPDESGSAEEDRPDSGGSEEVYPFAPEGSE